MRAELTKTFIIKNILAAAISPPASAGGGLSSLRLRMVGDGS